MRVLVELTIIPLGTGVSLSPYVAKCQDILNQMQLNYTLHAFGTNIEGDWDTIFSAIKKCHQALHEDGVARVASTIKVGTRNDKLQTLNDKIKSVQSKCRK